MRLPILALITVPVVLGAQNVQPSGVIAHREAALVNRLDTAGAVVSRAEPSQAKQRKRRVARPFDVGNWYVSPRIWTSGIEQGSKAYGLTVEKGIGDPDDESEGAFGVGADLDYYKFDFSDQSISIIPVGATANYHFFLSNPHWDPFIGAGIAYLHASAFGESFGGTIFQTQAGIRYYVTDATAIGLHVGTGIGNLAFSATLKF